LNILGFEINKKSNVNNGNIRELENSSGLSAFTGEYFSETGHNVFPKRAYTLAQSNADLGGVVRKIAGSFAILRLGVKQDSEDTEIRYGNPFLEFLAKSHEGYSATQFKGEIAKSFLLTNSAFVVLRGNISRPPLSKTFIRPYDISVIMGTDGIPDRILTLCRRDRRTYSRFEKNGTIRFIDDMGLNELCCIIGEVSQIDDWSGKSPIEELFDDIGIGTSGKTHNRSLLENGFRKDAIISPSPATKDGMAARGKEFVKGIIESISRQSGARKAGGVYVVGDPINVLQTSQNNKDMDFMALLKLSKENIADMYNYPLALMATNAMTYDNYNTANRVFYTKCLFPIADRILDGLLATVGARFGHDVSKESLTYDPSKIGDLRPSLFADMVTLKQSQACRTDEIRQVGGFEEEEDGGKAILVNAGQIALSDLVMTVPNAPEATAQMRSSAPVTEIISASAPVSE